jgi:hypothetical protein
LAMSYFDFDWETCYIISKSVPPSAEWDIFLLARKRLTLL